MLLIIAWFALGTGVVLHGSGPPEEKLPLGKPGEVLWVGEQRKVVRDGDLTGRVDLSSLSDLPHLYAVGPFEGVNGRGHHLRRKGVARPLG
ncbi:MAG: hypothetical protein K2X87_25210 [Gemmataceae bacterium]|nr:hypothetical protein [Gemmataceae bacterium]